MNLPHPPSVFAAVLPSPAAALRAAAVIALAASLFALFAPRASAASGLEVSGWIPYWRTSQGVAEARKNIRVFTEVNPFAYSVTTQGALVDTAKLDGVAWDRLERDAERRDIRYVPTIMWSDAAAMDRVLNDPALRAQHVRNIVEEVTRGGFDGIDIDYEGKRASTRDGFSAFLRELRDALKDEDRDLVLQCTIEARMPLSARFAGAPPATIEYANDLPSINRACDGVRIMTYDQQTADVELQREHFGTPYAPIADVEWVRKVVEYMDDDIDRDKLWIGIPTYGHTYQLMTNTQGTGFQYTRLGAIIPSNGLDTAKRYKIRPERNESGELYFTYVSTDEHPDLPSQTELARLAPRGASSAEAAWQGALAYTRRTGRQVPVTFVTWSDAGAVRQKVELARDLDVAGVSIFSVGGTGDRALWRALR